MFQQMAGFTLLEGVLALALSSITTATALSYLDDWIITSEQTVLHYSQQVAMSSMQTHQIWAKAAGKAQPKWQDVVSLNGLDSHISSQGELALSSLNKNLCIKLNHLAELTSQC
jgi:type II secretory pathway component PulJ